MSSPETTTLVSIFHIPGHAREALQDLKSAGIPDRAIQELSGESKTAASEQMLLPLNLPAKDQTRMSEALQNGGSILIVKTGHALAEKAEDIFERHHARKIDEQSLTGTPAKAVGTAAANVEASGRVIPIVEEQLVIGKRKVQAGGVRVFSHMVETPVEQQVVLQEEHARIERHAVNRPITAGDLDALQNQTIEVHEMAEEAVVGKTARVVEEILIGKETSQRTEQVHDTVRKTQVEVDQLTSAETSSLKPANRK